MKLRVLTFPLAGLVAATAVTTSRTALPRVPQQAQITAACTPGSTPQVTPATVAMARTDIVQWRSVSSGATSWTITPKDTTDWLFAVDSITGNPEEPATSPEPLESAAAGHPYRYMVTITCSDGSSQVIDPDIVIGGGE
ncbi:MAG: hypothetical protein LJF04_06885 [Gemmatimonadetes bacterium]|nr:hypothetical protein [Gemmatimonadota bacterium]